MTRTERYFSHTLFLSLETMYWGLVSFACSTPSIQAHGFPTTTKTIKHCFKNPQKKALCVVRLHNTVFMSLAKHGWRNMVNFRMPKEYIYIPWLCLILYRVGSQWQYMYIYTHMYTGWSLVGSMFIVYSLSVIGSQKHFKCKK